METKFIHREETFQDHAVEELAKSRAACICRVQFGRCTEDECARCTRHQQYTSCYKQFSDYDKARCDHAVAQYYKQYSLWPDQWSSYNGIVKRLFLISVVAFVMFTLIVCAVLFVAADLPYAGPNKKSYINYETDDRIIRVIKEVQSKVYDLNGDHKVNCIDYTLAFKVIWDRHYENYRCEIIRNKNGSFHHLFIMVKDGLGHDYYVEPWADNPYRYLMTENWTSDTYDPAYNIRGETVRWLNEYKNEIF